ncbi:competence type IV pilus minor pilin ComGF [Lactobacillus corticis]|uniref:Competence protein ComGF n=1 Tax=Lactobacillus corticis TaxID=2201249 RepID=A0A916QIQ9_9LACO|nr:competence type IV pilus minor pilin ComGF [Lactobacillus corticis]GFZ27128.1 hypothetical protein LCB40_10080 [Lactobacillus corticis]
MKQVSKLIKLKTNAFTLLEAVISLMITALVVNLLALILQTVQKADRLDHRRNEVAFAGQQFERFLKKQSDYTYTLPRFSTKSQAKFWRHYVDYRGVKMKQIFTLKWKNRSIVVSPGYMPLVTKVKKARFQTDDRFIRINLEETNGRQSQLIFKLDQAPKEEKEHDKKASTEKVQG